MKKREDRSSKRSRLPSATTVSLRDEEPKYLSRAVAKAFSILEILKTHPGPLELREIATFAGLTKSSAFRLLQTLEQLTYVGQCADGRYELGRKHLSTPGAQIRELLVSRELPSLHSLREKFQETVNVAVLFQNHIEVVCVLESPHPVLMANTVGRILSPHASSLGKAITAFQPDDVRRRLLTSYGLVRFTPSTITDETQLRILFDKIREDGIAREEEESTSEGHCFGAPFFQRGPAAVGAISISFPRSRAPVAESRIRMMMALRKAAATISDDLAKRKISSF